MEIDEIVQTQSDRKTRDHELNFLVDGITNGVTNGVARELKNLDKLPEVVSVLSKAVDEMCVAISKVKPATINIPPIKIPDIVVPKAEIEVKIPDIVVPEPKVTVNVEKQDAPVVNVPAPTIVYKEKTSIGTRIPFLNKNVSKATVQARLTEETPIYKDGELDGFIEIYSDGSRIKKTGLSTYHTKYEYL